MVEQTTLHYKVRTTVSSVVKEARRFRLLIVPFFLFALLLPVLSLDVIARLLANFGTQDRGNLILLTFYEAMRALRGLLGLGAVAFIVVTRAEQTSARALAWLLLFGVIAFGLAFGGGGYVGPFQEWLTRFLLGHGVSRSVLLIAFGNPDWAAWLALAALVRFTLLFPEPLGEEVIEESGSEDRAGLLRSVPGAGLDVGSSARRLVVAAKKRGWLNEGPLWIACTIGGLLSIVLRASPAKPLLWIAFLVLLSVAITAVRASWVSGSPDARRRVRWLARSCLAGVLLFLASGVAGLTSGTASEIAVVVLISLAPIVVLFGFSAALLTRGPASPFAQRRVSVKVEPVDS